MDRAAVTSLNQADIFRFMLHGAAFKAFNPSTSLAATEGPIQVCQPTYVPISPSPCPADIFASTSTLVLGSSGRALKPSGSPPALGRGFAGLACGCIIAARGMGEHSHCTVPFLGKGFLSAAGLWVMKHDGAAGMCWGIPAGGDPIRGSHHGDPVGHHRVHHSSTP